MQTFHESEELKILLVHAVSEMDRKKEENSLYNLYVSVLPKTLLLFPASIHIICPQVPGIKYNFH